MKQPTVSIIVNAYNGARYLREALDCARAQSWTDWELVFWDDQSTDDTAEIFKSYDDPRFRYFYAPQRTTLGRARSAAIAQARGEWLAFLDQDDVWTRDKLESQMALLRRPRGENVGLIYGRAVLLDAGGNERVHDHRHEFSPLPEGDIFVDLFEDSCFIAMSTVMVRTSAYHAVGGIPDGYDFAIDYHLYIALARQYEARAVQEPCCWYRVHESSMSRRHRAEILREMLRIIDSWAGCLEPSLANRRRKVHEALLGLEEILAGRVASGFARIVRRGSPPYLLSRPFVRSWRSLRRKVRRAPWSPPAQRA